MTFAIRLCLTAALTVAPLISASAKNSGSADDQMACTPDVYRLCASHIPDEDAIVACLEANRASLSPECGKVFARPAKGAAPSQDDD